jgi:hypothetical protein
VNRVNPLQRIHESGADPPLGVRTCYLEPALVEPGPCAHVLMGVRTTAWHNNLDIRQTVPNGSPLPAGSHRDAAEAGLASCVVVCMGYRIKKSQPLSARCSWKCIALNPPGVNPLQRIQESAAEQDAALYGRGHRVR